MVKDNIIHACILDLLVRLGQAALLNIPCHTDCLPAELWSLMSIKDAHKATFPGHLSTMYSMPAVSCGTGSRIRGTLNGTGHVLHARVRALDTYVTMLMTYGLHVKHANLSGYLQRIVGTDDIACFALAIQQYADSKPAVAVYSASQKRSICSHQSAAMRSQTGPNGMQNVSMQRGEIAIKCHMSFCREHVGLIKSLRQFSRERLWSASAS